MMKRVKKVKNADPASLSMRLRLGYSALKLQEKAKLKNKSLRNADPPPPRMRRLRWVAQQ